MSCFSCRVAVVNNIYHRISILKNRLFEKPTSCSVFPLRQMATRGCKAYGVKSETSMLAPMHIERRTPTAKDVVIDILYCGLCHSDVHYIRNDWNITHYPLVPGHEIVGRVREIGESVDKFKVGDTVGVGLYVDSCRACSHCSSNAAQYCQRRIRVFGTPYQRDGGAYTNGGFSKNIVVDQNFINSIPSTVPLGTAAPLLCAGVTVFTPIMKCRVGPGVKFAVIGLGGLGHMAVKYGVSLGADVTVIELNEQKREDAKQMGAVDFLTPTVTTFAENRQRFDVLMNTIPVHSNFDSILNMVRIKGTLVMIGLPPKPISLQAHSIIHFERNLTGSLVGSIDEAQLAINYSAEHMVFPEIEFVSINQINQAVDRLINGDVRYRFVVDMSTLTDS